MRKIVLLSLLVLLAGCNVAKKTEQPVSNQNQSQPAVSEAQTEVIPVTIEDIMSKVERGYEFDEIGQVDLALPAGINQAQIKKYFKLDDIMLALVLQPSMNVVLTELPSNFVTTFTGIIVARDNDTQWTKMTTITDSQPTDKNNPYYIWTKDKKVYLNVVDQNGAGSGEGTMKVLTIGDKGRWTLDNCYYFGEKYNQAQGDYFAFSKKLNRQRTLPLEQCNNVIFNGETQTAANVDLFDIISTHGVKVKNEAAYDQHNFTFKETLAYPLGRPELLFGKKQTFTSGGQSVTISMKDLSNLEVSFPQAPTATQTIASYFDENSLWFHLAVIFEEYTPNKFYLADRSGDTNYTRYSYFDGSKWLDYNKKIESALASKFKDDFYFPPYTLKISPSYISFTEENSFGDTSFDPDNENRVKYRKTFLLDKNTLKVLEEDKVAR